MTRETPTAPRWLRASTRKWFADVCDRWLLEEHHVRLLLLACQSWDRCAQAREAIAKDGLTLATGAGGHKLNPAVRVEQESMIAFTRILRELDLDIGEPPSAAKRPPSLRSIG